MGIPWWFKARTLCFHCQLVKFQSLSSYGNKDPISCVGRTKKKNQKLFKSIPGQRTKIP